MGFNKLCFLANLKIVINNEISLNITKMLTWNKKVLMKIKIGETTEGLRPE